MKKIVPADSILLPSTAQQVFAGKIFSVHHWQQDLYDGTVATFEMLKRPDTTNAICIVDGKVIILDDEQPNRPSLKTFPGGRVDPEDTSILAGAQREVLEEVGYTFANWRLIRVSQPIRKIEWFTYLYIAWDLVEEQAPHVDAGEKITCAMTSFDELKQLVMRREGYLSECYELFEGLGSLDDLLALPDYQGREVDR